MEIREHLENTRNLLKDVSRWTRDVYACTGNLSEVSPRDANAARFCAVGAVLKCTDSDVTDLHSSSTIASKLIDELSHYAHLMGYAGITQLNDHGGHEKVIEMFDRSISDIKRKDSAV